MVQNGRLRQIVKAVMTALFALLIAAFAVTYPQAEGEGPKDVKQNGIQTLPFDKNGQSTAFEVTGYDFRAKVGKDHSYRVVEKISVSIPEDLASVEFSIPSGNFRISDIEVEDTAYAAKKASEASTVSIVDPAKLTKGSHVYTIKYRISEYQDKDSSKDMFYFNVLLPEWKQPIGKVDIRVAFPEDFPWDDMQCYAGQYGVQDSTGKIKFSADKTKRTVAITGSRIPENYGITLKAQLPDGYWEDALNGSWAFTAALVSMTAALLILAVLWMIGGRDPKVKREAVTRPPEGLEPVELGYIFNSTVGIRDVLLMIVDFARKGYLRISEYEPKRYRLFREKDPSDEEKMYRSAYSLLFEDIYRGRAVDMEDLGTRLELIVRAIKDDVAAGFPSSDSLAFTPLSRTFRYAGAAILGAGLALADAFSYIYDYQPVNYGESIIIGLAAAAASLLLCREVDMRDSSSISAGRLAEIGSGLLTAAPVLYAAFRIFRNTRSGLLAASVVVLSAVSVFFIVIMRARGQKNSELAGRIRQLRNFIYHPTPKELLENYLEDPGYYYEMLIYALAFGAEEAWAISFLTLDVPEPEFYSDEIEGHAFSNLRGKATTVDHARDLRAFVRTIENAYNDMERHAGKK